MVSLCAYNQNAIKIRHNNITFNYWFLDQANHYRCSSCSSSSCWGDLFKKDQGSIVSNWIRMKSGRNVPVSHWLESDFGYNMILSRWRQWRHFVNKPLAFRVWVWRYCLTVCTTEPHPQYICTYCLTSQCFQTYSTLGSIPPKWTVINCWILFTGQMFFRSPYEQY